MIQNHADGVKGPSGYPYDLSDFRWWRLWRAIKRFFDREGELVRLRITCGMLVDARRADAAEYQQLERACQKWYEDWKTERAESERLRRNAVALDPTPLLTFARVTAINLDRCNRWHQPGGINDWTPERWCTAMMGEAGEVANALKKLFRVQDQIANVSEPGREIQSHDEAVKKIGEELADTFLYLNLLACRLGIKLEDEIVAKFNSVSERYGFPERL